jgi:hypothetical protein
MSFEFRSTDLYTLLAGARLGSHLPHLMLHRSTWRKGKTALPTQNFTCSPHVGCALARRLYPKQHNMVKE